MNISRYAGAKPFETDQESIFHGRRQDTDALYRLIRAEPLVVLYGKSGLGKSSLLNAGIIPRVRRERDFVSLPIRFHAFQAGESDTPVNIARQTIVPKGAASTFLDALIKDEPTLWHDVKEAQIQGKRLLLVFDQFEELFTYPKEQVTAFKQELAEALFTKLPQRYLDVLEQQLADETCTLTDDQINGLSESPELRVVFAIRSDRVHLLNALNDYLPTIQRHTFELAPLSIDGAKEAILLPARDPNPQFTKPVFDYETAAVDKIIAFLTKNGKERIESTHLQIVCKSVEDKVPLKTDDTAALPPPLMTANALGNLDDVVTNFYHDTLAKITDETQRAQARRFIEDQLIFDKENGDGDRLSIYEGIAWQKYKLTEATTRLLINEHLLREEPRLQGEGYTLELSHDTLIKPVLASKAQHYEQERLRQEAAEKAQRAAELAEAKRQADIEKRRRQRATTLSVAAVIGLLFALTAMFWAFKQQKKAEDALRVVRLKEFEKDLTLARGQLDGGVSCLSDDILNRLQAALKEFKTDSIKTEIQTLNQNIQKNNAACPIIRVE